MKNNKKRNLLLSLILAAVCIAFLLYVDKFQHYSMLATVLKKGAIYSLVAVSLNLLNGFTGLFSLGQAGFMLLGAYTYAILTVPMSAKDQVYYLFGGSAGREGAALQLGGSIAGLIGKISRLDEKDMHIMTMCGMSAVFAALFGTPLTATLFALEVISVGVIYYSALVPCIVASLFALEMARIFGIAPTHFDVVIEPISELMLLKVSALAIVCSLMSTVFCLSMHKTEHLFAKLIKNPYLRIAAGGALVVLITAILGTGDYNGAGMNIIKHAIEEGQAKPDAFFWKLILTAITIGCGFKGGEVVPTFFIGATLGCVLGSLLGIPTGFAAALGLICVFCGAVNCPVASIILSVELFGSGELLYFALACGISYMLSGYFGLYSSQKIMYSKTRAEFINRYAK